tara:strand:+ start:335 stop:565 length:231 start_codon:yes stop_codon:yes gene_type:complete
MTKITPKKQDLSKVIIWNNDGLINAYKYENKTLMFSSQIADKFCEEWNRVDFNEKTDGGVLSDEINFKPIIKLLKK